MNGDGADSAVSYPVETLIDFAAGLLSASGLAAHRARQVAGTLVEADCFGHDTHGLALLPRYLAELTNGTVDRRGEIRLIRDGGSVLLFDAGLLPGPVAVHHALDIALQRLSGLGAISLVIRNSGHIACLATYLERATRRNAFALIMSSNPAVALVVPHGARRPVYSPDPIAFGFPTRGDPVLIDVSMSAVSANGCRTAAERGERLSGSYLRRPDGAASDDPTALFSSPPASLMPLGGADLGHKGFGLALMVEILTSGLAGRGRSGDGAPLSNTTFIYLADPEAFGGAAHALDEAGWLVAACRAAGMEGDVRLPGERALARRRHALANGMPLPPRLRSELGKAAIAAGIPSLGDIT